jgi:hypothetical protein
MLGNTDVIVTRAALAPPCYRFISVSFHDVWTLKQKRNKPMPVTHRRRIRFCFISVLVLHVWAPLKCKNKPTVSPVKNSGKVTNDGKRKIRSNVPKLISIESQ